MVALLRVTVKLNIYHDDSDVPTQDSLGDKNKKVFAYIFKLKNCEETFLNYVHVQRKLEINLQGSKVDVAGRTWLAGIERLLFMLCFLSLPWSHIFVCKVCV